MKRVLLLFIIVSAVLVSGCWDSRELNELGIVSAVAVDLDENKKWVVTYQVVIPQSNKSQDGGGGQAPVTVFSSTGRTITEATDNARIESPRSFFFAHSRVLVMSQRVARYGINPIVDFYLRNTDRRETVEVVITAGEARKIIEVLTPLERVPGNTLNSLLKGVGGEPYYAFESEMHSLITILGKPTGSVIVTEIRISGDQKEQTSLEALGKTRSAAVVKLGGSGVLKGDKFAGWLTRQESLGAAWLTGRVKRASVVFPCKAANRREDLSSFQVDKARRTLKPKISDGNLIMDVVIDLQGTFMETGCKLNLKKPENINKLLNYIQEPIKSDVIKAFTALQKLKADPIGFGDAFHKAYPGEWKKLSKNWENEFTRVKMNVTVKAKVRRVGMSDDSFAKISGKND
jgi:spore germination protein KC